MRIAILGAGKMGSFFARVLCLQHEVALYDADASRLEGLGYIHPLHQLEEISGFQPELLINAVTLKFTLDAFSQVLPLLPADCVISDIASVKTGLSDYYRQSGFRYVSSHPMFGPTFANLEKLSSENAIVITEGDEQGRAFFRDLYLSLHLNLYEYSFQEHDRTAAYSLSIPFVSTLVFSAVMKHQDAPGTTFKKHLDIAKGLMSEDDYLLQEILFNPETPAQINQICIELLTLQQIIRDRNASDMKNYLNKIRKNLE